MIPRMWSQVHTQVQLMRFGKHELINSYRSAAKYYGFFFYNCPIVEQNKLLLVLPDCKELINNLSQLQQLCAAMHPLICEQFIDTNKEVIRSRVHSLKDLQILSLYVRDFNLTHFFTDQFDLSFFTKTKITLSEVELKVEHHFFKALVEKIQEANLFSSMIEKVADIAIIFKHIPLSQLSQIKKLFGCLKLPLNAEDFLKLFQWIDVSIQADALVLFLGQSATKLPELTIKELTSIQWCPHSQRMLAEHVHKSLLVELQQDDDFDTTYPFLNKNTLLSYHFKPELKAHLSVQTLSTLCSLFHKAALGYNQHMKTHKSGFFSCCSNDKRQHFFTLQIASQWIADFLTNETPYTSEEFNKHSNFLRNEEQKELNNALDELEQVINLGCFNQLLSIPR